VVEQPTMTLRGLKCTCMYLPKRLELSLRTVLALPNASSTGLAIRILFSMPVISDSPSSPRATSDRRWRHCMGVRVTPHKHAVNKRRVVYMIDGTSAYE